MQNGTEEGLTERDFHERENVDDNHSENHPLPTAPIHVPAPLENNLTATDNANIDLQPNGTETPPAKRRKLTGFENGKLHRATSPPWRKVAVEGPSTFVEGGVRKSARTNYVPVDLQTHSEKRKTRRAAHSGKPPVIKSKYGGASVTLTDSPAMSSTTENTNDCGGHHRSSSAGKPSNNIHPKSSGRSKSTHSDGAKSSAAAPVHANMSNPKQMPQTSSSTQTQQGPQPLDAYRPRKVGRPPRSSLPGFQKNQPGSQERHENDLRLHKEHQNNSAMNSGMKKPQRLSLRFNMPSAGIHHPENIVRRNETVGKDGRKSKFSSFSDWLDREGRLGLEGDVDPRITEQTAQREAHLRRRISEAAKPGGVLSQERCLYWRPERTEEPPRPFRQPDRLHQDRLLGHVINFQTLLGRERLKHLKAARECAQNAATFVQEKRERDFRTWKKGQPKSAEEIEEEKRELCKSVYEQLQDDIKQKWLMVHEIVEDLRMQRWQAEQDRLGKEALNEAIEKSRGLLSRRARVPSSPGSGEEGDSPATSANEADSESQSEEDSQDEDNMSSSNSESDEGQDPLEDDEGLTLEELRQKYSNRTGSDSNMPEKPPDEEAFPLTGVIEQTENFSEDRARILEPTVNIRADNPRPSTSPQPTLALENVDDALMDDSNASTDMSDDMGSSDGDSSPNGPGSEHSEEDSDLGLLGGFFTKTQRNVFRTTSDVDLEMTKEQSSDFQASDDEADKVSLVPDVTQGPTPSASTSEEPQLGAQRDQSQDPAVEPPPHTLALEPSTGIDLSVTEPSPEDQASNILSNVHMQDTEMPATPVSTQALKTPVPSLLRGTLREYQHYGLDWLAGLYANGTNGILADEMGLGKTIQTIALLAHLAVHHEAWGPHLIVVPTSVMLNWEMEFKKFLPGFKVLTYYGTQEERKRKRAGWMDDSKWNVWITSYTLITQDQQIFKRKAWHYMILDEAHNIKNFQSLRWQTLLTFRTRARLLLTGTPLQNNLTELWSLLYFLMPSEESEKGIAGFNNLDEFTQWFKKPSEQILEQGKETLDNEAREAVRKLHDILRPYLLRRLKADVEQQMPGKYEHVIYCKLSKRQRYLYDGFMSRAQTRETLASGNTFSVMNALMQLRKVCNHPDLFETRQIVTSFAMPKSAVADFEIKELLVRRRLLQEEPMMQVDLSLVNLLPGSNGPMSALDTIQKQRLGALGAIRQLTSQQCGRVNWDMRFDGSSIDSTLAHFENNARRLRYDKLHQTSYLTSLRSQKRPLYSHDLMDRLRFGIKTLPHQPRPRKRAEMADWYTSMSPTLHDIVLSLPERSNSFKTTIEKFGCITPTVVATDLSGLAMTSRGTAVVQEANNVCQQDPFHDARVRLSIAFPDKRLLQYDCGKLQQLDGLLRRLQSGGHRALIFTQMTRVLDILEQFMNIHGHRYLRLDGATKVEQRQMLTERFNNDNRILAFILSSRSGGIGINLTGADTVIFYDLDWNPAMDKQCQDRCHRIGQTRDVHVYRLVSEYTIEANILRKANQKRMLDDVVIQGGEFTTDYFNNMSVKDIVGDHVDFGSTDDVANKAMDMVLGKRGAQGRVLEAVEDQDDAKAAKEAEKEAVEYDAEDFDEKGASSGGGGVGTPKTPAALDTPSENILPPQRNMQGEVEVTTTMEATQSGLVMPNVTTTHDTEKDVASCDEYMIRFLDRELRSIPFEPPADKKKKKKGGKESLGRKK
ncbi:uncharacterized protein KY384_001450 [Bacidia gigantensis]|uniref:uncharacterized protein n=1 Tax=Bacidia gigantensis TaxID=2732470 RepID=UPI001D03DBEA|nr:uncharacterized protein KY384_001450 [Bacidia gigantensis]KAG8533709.1 hypothetical protein KY384_001450 [Bacidia gigantensis]